VLFHHPPKFPYITRKAHYSVNKYLIQQKGKKPTEKVMSESGRRHGGAAAETGRGEQLLAEEASGELSSLSWRLNVKEFQLPRPSPTHHHHNNLTCFTFHGLFPKPSKKISLFIFIFFTIEDPYFILIANFVL